MRIVMFYHSLLSDWNHGNAHFLRGVVRELIARGHQVVVYEERDNWSLRHLLETQGQGAVEAFHTLYPELESRFYESASLDLDLALDGADLVLVHEWNDHDLVARIGAHRAKKPGYRLLFHDTHHRSISDPESMGRYDLRHYDAVLAFGEVIRSIYLERGWAEHVWTWHEAADTSVFHPLAPPDEAKEADLVWVGNWGDDERSAEIMHFLVEPVRRLGLRARVQGVRYPEEAVATLRSAGIHYGGWVANFQVPQLFAKHKVTVHIPRSPYARTLKGIPTIRPFEALACSIPLISAPWEDAEGLFRPGEDYLVARDGEEMTRHLRRLVNEAEFARELADRGRRTLLSRHTCSHRVDELLSIVSSLQGESWEERRKAG